MFETCFGMPADPEHYQRHLEQPWAFKRRHAGTENEFMDFSGYALRVSFFRTNFATLAANATDVQIQRYHIFVIFVILRLFGLCTAIDVLTSFWIN
jgi:hypothetical protein